MREGVVVERERELWPWRRGGAVVTARGEREAVAVEEREELWSSLHVERESSGCGERGSCDDDDERKSTTTISPKETGVIIKAYTRGGMIPEGASYFLSWRLAVEANNARGWRTVPSQCLSHVEAYMLGGQYDRDLDLIADQILSYINEISSTMAPWMLGS
uniref:Uncharacterized protein n=1 Tax=Salix viminalis TaxID=40686 RepID=A0A6N2KDF1_SALVM